MSDPKIHRSWQDAWNIKSKQIAIPLEDSDGGSSIELKTFQENLEDTLQTGDIHWVEPWLTSVSRSLHGKHPDVDKASLTLFVSELMQVTFEAMQENMQAETALLAFKAITPCFGILFERASHLEIQANADKVKDNLAEAQYRLEQLERSKSNFTSIAAHELKTPLTLIEGYTAILKDTLCLQEGSDNALKLLDGIRNGTQRLGEIINDMIDVSLIDNHMLKPNIQPVWLGHIFNSLQTDLNRALKDRHQNLEIAGFPGYEDMIYGDPKRLTQVFRNILTNAIKFTPDGGSIKLSGKKFPDFIEITIKDTGIGIPAEELNTVFEKFSQLGRSDLHSSSKSNFKGGGPGLGLYIARGIMETLDGRIWAESNDSIGIEYPGTTFHVLLPTNYELSNQRAGKLRETDKNEVNL